MFQRRTMLRNFFLALAVAALTLPASAQVKTQIEKQINNPRLDIFGGYSHVGNYGIGLNGWIMSANWHLYRYIGLEGDISGGYGSQNLEAGQILPNLPNSIGSRMHNFNFGPNGTWRAPSGKYNAFGHLLLGFSHTNVNSAGIGQGDTAFSWVLGGGGDYNLNRVWAARAQVDLLHTRFFNGGQNHGRISLGLVYHMGQRD
jgi:Outer membrane protein beta-barrel domain